MRRKLILATMILAAAALLASCGSQPKPEYRPDLTSDDLNIYQNGQMLCDRDGVQISDELTRDTQGNVLDDEGNVLISAANLRNFTWVVQAHGGAEKHGEFHAASDELRSRSALFPI